MLPGEERAVLCDVNGCCEKCAVLNDVTGCCEERAVLNDVTGCCEERAVLYDITGCRDEYCESDVDSCVAVTCAFEVNCKVLNFKNEEELQYTSVNEEPRGASLSACCPFGDHDRIGDRAEHRPPRHDPPHPPPQPSVPLSLPVSKTR